MKKLMMLALAAALGASPLLADFSYEQITKLTGGAMAGVMRFMSKQLRDGVRTTVLVKGDRMANISPQGAHIIDLSKETITEINFEKKTYSVITFAQMAEAMKQLEAKLANQKGGQEQVSLTMKPSVKDTGETRQIAGMNTHKVIVTIEMEGKDQKTGEPRAVMNMSADLWLAPQVAGYDEVRNFYKRMAEKINWMPGSSMFGATQPGSAKGMSEMYKEMSKIDGVPVLQVTRMGGMAGSPEGAGEAGEQTPPPQQQQPQAEPEKPSAGGALGRLGGRFGGLGGLGRRKKQEEAQQQPEAGAQAQQAQQRQAGGPPSLMEMTTELSGFSTGAVDASKFDVPAGFKQVESEMLKTIRR